MKASGMCHSDEHLVTGDLAGATSPMPLIGGHEGAGIVMEVGEGVVGLEPGDHVVFGFIPACGRCPSCASVTRTCATSAVPPSRPVVRSPTAPHATTPRTATISGSMCLLGTFANHTVVHESSCVKIDKDLPLDRACLLGCGVVTGWGSAVYAAEVQSRRLRCRRRRWWYRLQCDPGSQARRGSRDRCDRSGRVQARDRDGARRDPHVRVDRRGDGSTRRLHLGPRFRQGDHDHGRGRR